MPRATTDKPPADATVDAESGLAYDVKHITSAGPQAPLSDGVCNVVDPVTRRTS